MPLLPAVAGQVLSLARSQDTRAAELAQVIHSDQSLVSHVLRVANSAAYGWNAQIVSLHQAVARLGFERIAEIALAVAVGGRLFRPDRRKAELQRLWSHSVAAAFCAQEAARLLRRNAETAFLCGLLHDIGKPVVLEAVQSVENSLGWELRAEIAVLLMEEATRQLLRTTSLMGVRRYAMLGVLHAAHDCVALPSRARLNPAHQRRPGDARCVVGF